MTRPITFLSDYGYGDEFAGVCRAVIARIAPDAQVIDLTHGVPRQAVRHGAIALAGALPFTPPGIHLAVVDPGVGSERRPVAVLVADDDRVLVGPDNGVLSLAIERLGGASRAVDLTDSPFRLESVSNTFHGRDLFAPVAAQLAGGGEIATAGDPIDPSSLVRLELPTPVVYPDHLVAHVLHIDGFGNAALNLPFAQAGRLLNIGAALMVEAGKADLRALCARAYADVEDKKAVVFEDSAGYIAIAVNGGSAAEQLGLADDDEVVLRPAEAAA
jgi:S-adenosylmethionine hydrolase